MGCSQTKPLEIPSTENDQPKENHESTPTGNSNTGANNGKTETAENNNNHHATTGSSDSDKESAMDEKGTNNSSGNVI